jgi:tetratricopeptide (TPR) repeat protein
MPKSARVLQFPVRSAAAVCTAEGARRAAQTFLAEPHALRTSETWEYLANPDVILEVLALLNKIGNSQPEYGHGEAVAAYEQLSHTAAVGVFDERDYFLGEMALLAGNTARVAGRFDTAAHWFDLSDSAFRHTINAAPLLVRVAHARLALRYDMGRYSEVLELLPTVVGEYTRLGMPMDAAKAKFLEAVTLKQLGESDRSFAGLLALRAAFEQEPKFQSLVLTSLAEEYGRRDDGEQAIVAYEEALVLTRQTGDTVASIHLKVTIGEAYRAKGNYAEAIGFLRAATLEASELGMQARLAYVRVLLAECLLAAGRGREAEWEILAALPVIEEQKMVAEGVSAIAILRESVNRRRIDGSALADLRHRLSAL